MRKHNKWTRGRVELRVPPLPPELRQRSGCIIDTATFDRQVGPEVYLAILEDTEYAAKLARTRPFELFCKPGLARTSHGMVVFMLFTVRSRDERVAWYELFLDPHQMGTIKMLSAWGQQSHFKALVIDYEEGRVRDWFEFENSFGIGEVAATVGQTIGHEPKGNFQLAQQEFMRDYSVDDL